jgi:2-haloacid dehalogenase
MEKASKVWPENTIQSIHRRRFITTSVTAMVGAGFQSSSFSSSLPSSNRIKAIAFDAFPVFDPRPVFDLLTKFFPEKGVEFANIWRTTLFEYCWLRSLAGAYKDFWKLTDDSLLFAAKKAGVNLTTGQRDELMVQFLHLDIWPDVIPALQSLKQSGVKLAFLSNMTPAMLSSCMGESDIEGYFDEVISTDRIKSYKPDPRAYKLGTDILKLRKEEILFAAFAGWDACGAKWFGYPTFWVNRANAPAEQLGVAPDGEGHGLADMVNFIRSY